MTAWDQNPTANPKDKPKFHLRVLLITTECTNFCISLMIRSLLLVHWKTPQRGNPVSGERVFNSGRNC